ncbi:MAG: mechanosensitive ion channel family protein, partial [Bacteroidaceae bacterium]|nr:mechanosensitive ion channel family protein [Bacteroidaceae bacterium]
MKINKTSLIVMLLSAVFMTTVHAQDIQESESAVEEIDSLAAVSDSIINELRQEINELKLRELIMQQQIDLSEKDDLEDSLRRATLKANIDSLRSKTTGAPLVVNGDTLLFVYARKGGMLPEARVEDAEEKILKAGKRMSMFLDSIYIYESDMQADIMIGDEVLLSVTDMDALWNDTERMVLAVQFKQIIERKINELHDEYGLKQKLKGFALALLIISCLVGLIWVTLWLFGRWKDRLALKILKKIKPWQMKNYVLMDIHKLGVLIFVVFNLLKLLLILVLVLISIPLLFSIFPETKDFTFAVLGYLWNPVKHILRAVVDYIPNLFQIIVIVLCFRYVIKLIRYFANEIANENLKITGFYPDWAMPTFVILRILLYSFMLVMIWPLLPKSDSEIFQG